MSGAVNGGEAWAARDMPQVVNETRCYGGLIDACGNSFLLASQAP
jgi:hypothetical protein